LTASSLRLPPKKKNIVGKTKKIKKQINKQVIYPPAYQCVWPPFDRPTIDPEKPDFHKKTSA
ncbi:MAG: hypothetical protein ACKVJQ_00165, partial [Alphaproteobacteria bacterium]